VFVDHLKVNIDVADFVSERYSSTVLIVVDEPRLGQFREMRLVQGGIYALSLFVCDLDSLNPIFSGGNMFGNIADGTLSIDLFEIADRESTTPVAQHWKSGIPRDRSSRGLHGRLYCFLDNGFPHLSIHLSII